MSSFAHWAAFCAIAASARLPAQDTPDSAENEIVVIARKMRKVRLEYTMFGPHFRRCDVAVSSGDARIDRVVCAILKACVSEGHRNVAPARECVRRKIGTLETHRDPEKGAASIDAAPSPVAASQAAPVAPQAERTTAPAPDRSDEVIVTAPRLPTSGYWRFRVMRAAIRAAPAQNSSPASWGQCIGPDAAETTLQQMIGKDVNYSASGVCKVLKLAVSEGKIVGERRCLSQAGRSLSRIDGSYGADQIRYEEQTEFVMLKRPEGGGRMESETVSLVTGSRVGDCRGSRGGR